MKSKLTTFILTLALLFSMFYSQTFALPQPTQTQAWVCGKNPSNNNVYETYKISVNKYTLSNKVDVLIPVGATFDETRLIQLFSDYDTQLNKLLYYGNPDKDGDGKIVFLFWNGLGGAIGRYNPFHQNPAYDGKDVVEINLDYALKTTSMYSVTDCKGSLYHEMQHMITNQYDPYETAVVNEGCSTYIEKDLGYNMTMRISEYVASEYNFQTQTYSKDFLFMDFLAQKFGGKDVVKDIIKSSDSGFDGIIKVLAKRGYNITLKDLFKDFEIYSKIDKASVDLIDYDIWSQAKYVAVPTANLNATSISGIVTGWKTNWTYVRPASSSILITANPGSDMKIAIISLDTTLDSKNGRPTVGSNPVVNVINAGDSVNLTGLTSSSLLYITPLYTPADTSTDYGWRMTANWGIKIGTGSTSIPSPSPSPTPILTSTPVPTPSLTPKPTVTPTPTPVPTMPIPANVKITTTTTSLTFTWDNIKNATQYDCIFDSQSKSVATNSITFRDLKVGSKHTFQVRAKNSNLVGNYNTLGTYYTFLTTPSYLKTKVLGVTSSSIGLIWNSVPDATSYVLVIDGVEKNVGNLTTYIHTGLKTKTNHIYMVKALNGNTSSEYSTILSTLTK